MMKCLFFSSRRYTKTYFDKVNNAEFKFELEYHEAPIGTESARLTAGYDAVCVFVNDHVGSAEIEVLAQNGVKIIALRCAGFNNVNLKAAAKHNIKVVRVPAYSPYSIAEHTAALILTLNRKTHRAYNRVREANFAIDGLVGFDLHGQTVGVVGTGKIGAAFCRIMLGFGCKVNAFDLYKDQELINAGVNYVSFDDILYQSDIISLHCPLTPETKYLIDEKAINCMKDGVMLINTSRGGLINTKDVISGLKHHKIGYLGLDVYEEEENLFFEDLSETVVEDDVFMRLLTFPNVLITGHQAFFTSNALESIARTTLQNLSDFEAGQPLANEVVSK